jgi:hypothetical protein
MVGGLLFAVMLATSFAAAAESHQSVATAAGVVPAVTREICTEALWGYDDIRSDCRTEVRAAAKPNPALKGICTTYYGRRTCY